MGQIWDKLLACDHCQHWSRAMLGQRARFWCECLGPVQGFAEKSRGQNASPGHIGVTVLARILIMLWHIKWLTLSKG